MLSIMKFGGTSVNTPEHRAYAIAHIENQLKLGNKVLAVISAMGRKDEPYSTNTLLSFTDSLPEMQKDRLISQGEILSTLVFENECRRLKINAHACTPSETGIITDDSYGAAKIVKVSTLMLEEILKEVSVALVPGFIGVSLSGHVTTLGRGGSDKTAILLADAFCCKHVSIYTDVDGIYDADPKENPQAKRYSALTFDSCLDLVHAGACVMMEDSVKLAKNRRIPFTVASTFESAGGTKVGGKIDLL